MKNDSSVARYVEVRKAETEPLNSLAAEINCDWQVIDEELSQIKHVPVGSKLVFLIYDLVIAFVIGVRFACMVWLAF